MTQTPINVGSAPNAGDGDTLRAGFQAASANFTDLYSQMATKAGSGPVTSSGLTMSGPALLGKSTTGSGAVSVLDATATKTLLALDQVDNTSDAAKPLSSAATTALAGKEPTIASGTTSQYWRGDKTFQTLDKTAVGLSNVDNTSDAAKPISSATQAALDLKLNITDLPASPTTVVALTAWMPVVGASETVAMVASQAFTIVLADSLVVSGVAATASTTLDLQKNGTSIGNIAFAAASTTGTITSTVVGGLALVVGDVLEVIAPASPDATLARIAIVLKN